MRVIKKLVAPQKPHQPIAKKDVFDKYKERMELRYTGNEDLAKISLWRFASAYEARRLCMGAVSEAARLESQALPELGRDAPARG